MVKYSTAYAWMAEEVNETARHCAERYSIFIHLHIMSDAFHVSPSLILAQHMAVASIFSEPQAYTSICSSLPASLPGNGALVLGAKFTSTKRLVQQRWRSDSWELARSLARHGRHVPPQALINVGVNLMTFIRSGLKPAATSGCF